MKRLLLPLLAAIALPTAVNANWFGGKLLYLICDISKHIAYLDGKVIYDSEEVKK